MVEVKVSYEGSLRCAATHGPSKTTLYTDAPVDNMGKGESFSPTDLVATGLGACILTILGIVAQRHGLNLMGTHVRVQKEMTQEPPRRIASLKVDIAVPTPLGEQDKLRLQNAADTCPVKKSLHPDIRVPITWHWA
jgi:putative redox protein